MNKKGFTLIELLAVIVILAIIALIATPIVLNIIKDSKESAQLRSTEFYINGVEQIITKKLLNDTSFKVRECEIQKDGNLKCDGKTDVIEIEVSGEKPNSGKICISSKGIVDKVMVKYSNYYVSHDGKETKIIDKDTFDSFSCDGNDVSNVCTLALNGDVEPQGISAGDKYLCKVKNSMELKHENGYTFYVLSQNDDGTTNLIMDQNIYSDGTPAGISGVTEEENSEKYSLVSWVSKKDYNDDTNYGSYGSTNKGPLTAISFLYKATKDWVNVEPINYTYQDRLVQGIADGEIEGYTLFESENGIAKITSSTNTAEIATFGTSDYPLRARLPIYTANQEYLDKNEVALKNESNGYLYENLDSLGENPPYGYWTLSSHTTDPSLAWFVSFEGEVTASGPYDSDVSVYDYHGIRPIITLKL